MKKRGLRLLCVLMLFVLLGCLGCKSQGSGFPVMLRFLDVGQGDSALLRTADGDILIDAGTEAAQPLLCLRLEQLGVKSLRLLVITHADEDHMGGADGVISAFDTEEIWYCGEQDESEAAKRMFACLDPQKTRVTAPDPMTVRTFADVRLCVLYPFSKENAAGNEGSIILKLICREAGAIFTGDASAEEEALLIETYGKSQLDCDLYKVGHHGSNTSSSKDFLEVVSPNYAVISCGADNSYGHPTGEVLRRLADCGAEILRTDREGEIVFSCDGARFVCVSKGS